MNDLLALPYEVQIVLVSGYLGYKLGSAGRDKTHRVEDFLLQVLAYGLIARTAALVISDYSTNIPISALVSISASLFIASIWRAFGREWTLKIIHWIGIHRDDHEATTWMSLSSNPARWTFIQLHLDDGRTLESVFGAIPENNLPSSRLTINEDGILLYVTATYSETMDRTPQPISGNDNDFIVTYVPRIKIRQMEVGWRK